jgi:WD40 repeat protein
MKDFILFESKDGSVKVFGKRPARETTISPDEGILVIAPGDEAGLSAAIRIRERFEKIGVKAKILNDPSSDVLTNNALPSLVLGTLANSRCTEYLYYKHLVFTDLSYPGEEGYNIRTLIDPFGKGCNVFHIGYSDEKGLSLGLEAFFEKVQNPMPYMNLVRYKKLPYDPSYMEEIRQSRVPEKIDLVPSVHTSLWHYRGLLAYLTGDPSPLDVYFEGWEKMIMLSQKDPILIKATHLYMTAHVEIWRLLEFSGMIPDDKRLPIEKCIFDWAKSAEGVEYAVSGGKSKALPSHNHTMFCALSLTYAHDYFSKRYPEILFTKEWKEAADQVFYTFNHNGWKPLCDDSSYSNQVTLRLVVCYSIFEDEHRFLKTSAKEAAKWIKAIIGQNGMVPSYGDGSVKSPFPTFLSCVFAHFMKDGEMKWLYERFKAFNPEMNASLSRKFDSGIVPCAPEESPGITCILLDKYTYDVWEKEPEQAKRLSTTPPAGPYEDCFDKVSVRTGRDPVKDDFLLIDGLGSSGIHAYGDTMGILDYTSKGVVWLVEENDYRWPEPENCSIVTVARDGFASEVPGYALMEEQKALDENRYYLRMRLKDYNGTDWVREVHLIKGVCAVFRDTVICNEEGEYVINAHFRTPSKVSLEGNTVKSARRNFNGEEYEMRLSAYGSRDVTVNVEEIPYGKRLFEYGGMHEDDPLHNAYTKALTMWESRYGEKETIVSSVTSVSSACMKKGDRLSFTHIVQPAKKDEEAIVPRPEESDLVLSFKGKEERLSFLYTDTETAYTASDQAKDYEMPSIQKECVLDRKIEFFAISKENERIFVLEKDTLAWADKGQILRERTFDGKIRALEYIKPHRMLVVGYGNDKLAAFNDKGELLWDKTIVRIPTLYYSWELAYPQIVSIRYVETKDGPYILTGAGDNQVRVHDLNGEVLRAFYIYATVPDFLEFLDFDFDGEPEVLAAGKIDSAYGIFYTHTMDGVQKNAVRPGFWLNTIQSYRFVKEDNKYILVCGMKYSKNFMVLSTGKKGIKIELEKCLGGKVQAVEMHEDLNTVYAGTSKGFVMAFDRAGKSQWNANVRDGVKALYKRKDGLTVLCESGKILVLSDEGRILAQGSLPGKAGYVIKEKENIFVVCENAVYRI